MRINDFLSRFRRPVSPRVWADEFGINLATSDEPDCYVYDVDFDQLHTPDDAVLWGRQLAGKTWVTPPILQEFYRLALEHVSAHR